MRRRYSGIWSSATRSLIAHPRAQQSQDRRHAIVSFRAMIRLLWQAVAKWTLNPCRRPEALEPPMPSPNSSEADKSDKEKPRPALVEVRGRCTCMHVDEFVSWVH